MVLRGEPASMEEMELSARWTAIPPKHLPLNTHTVLSFYRRLNLLVVSDSFCINIVHVRPATDSTQRKSNVNLSVIPCLKPFQQHLPRISPGWVFVTNSSQILTVFQYFWKQKWFAFLCPSYLKSTCSVLYFPHRECMGSTYTRFNDLTFTHSYTNGPRLPYKDPLGATGHFDKWTVWAGIRTGDCATRSTEPQTPQNNGLYSSVSHTSCGMTASHLAESISLTSLPLWVYLSPSCSSSDPSHAPNLLRHLFLALLTMLLRFALPPHHPM